MSARFAAVAGRHGARVPWPAGQVRVSALSWIADHLTVVLGVALTLLAAVFVLQQRRTPQSAAAWLLFILVLPYLAIPLFVMLGFRKTGSGFSAIRFSRRGGEEQGHRGSDLAQVFSHFGLPPATTGNALELFSDGEAAFAAMMDIVRSAETSLDITFYLVADDEAGRTFVGALEEKAQSGVRVRLIIDRLGDLNRPREALRRLRAAGGHIRYFSPIVHLPAKGHLNLRNHRKMVIADRARVFSGGMNVAVEYMGPKPFPGRWSDLSYRIEGPAVGPFCDVHDSDWGAIGAPEEATPAACGAGAGAAVAQLVPSGPDRKDDALHDGLVYAIHAARRRVWIATPYFLPTEFLGQALATAARRGLDVRIVVPERSNHRIADFARGAYVRELSDAGCRILQYTKGMLHAKAGLIDDAAYVGSANFDVRSMLLNFETAMFLYDEGSVGSVAAWFERQQADCIECAVGGGLVRRSIEGVFRLGSPVL